MEYDKKVANRLKWIEGQIKGGLGMLEQRNDCRDIIIQLSATHDAIYQKMDVIVGTNLEQRVRE